eukprot:TRINITY_DN29394_c0_g1_i1.p1 TRINITY_DN29394_c0_g1~~TRINITY_DN29394_c0_g1_i1.p1  ORF type:complete len:431 (+),score=99.90 TRINITY_DN29394_c0_g1_i1:30-1295(+)
MRRACVLLACAAAGLCTAGTPQCEDEARSDSAQPASRIAFGSCHSMRRARSGGAFAWLQEYAPSRFFWTGDSVYVNTTDLEDLEAAYDNMTRFPDYATFVAQVGQANIDGTWDDHDYGVNDGGGEVPDKEERQNLFLRFLGKDGDARRRYSRREGTYSLHVLQDPSESGKRVGVIVLDTRMHRDDHYVPAFSRYGRHLPFSAQLSALSRLVSSFFRLYSEGDVLGAAQWAWLECVLQQHADLDGYVVVSSIQVTTSNPFVESWGHFPEAKRRLLQRLEGLPGVAFVSGDVHFAEISRWNEMTSSGMTHYLGTGWKRVPALVAKHLFNSHRQPGAVLHGLNFLGLDIDWAAGLMQFSIRTVGGEVALRHDVPLKAETQGLAAHAAGPAFVHSESPFSTCVTLLLTGAVLLATSYVLRTVFWR